MNTRITDDHQFSENKEDVKFESICTLEEHVVHQVSQWSTVDTLSWNGKKGFSDYSLLSAAADTNTRWEVVFLRSSDDDFTIFVRCVSLDAQFRAASIRLFAVVENHPQAWMETAEILKPGMSSSWWGCFTKKLYELPKVRPLKVCVRAQWSEFDRLPSELDLWTDSTVHISYSWQIKDWTAVTPTSGGWSLFSETFGQKGAFWRIFVRKECSGSNGALVVAVWLQHLHESVNVSGLSWNCSLNVWDQQFDQQKKIMKQRSNCEWKVVEDLKSELRNPLDLNIVIDISKEN